MRFRVLFTVLASILLLGSCKETFVARPTGKVHYRIVADSLKADAVADRLIQPYRSRLDSAMNVKIAEVESDLSKAQPEGSLGNLICDALMNEVKKMGKHADFCVLNNGGIRIPILYAGPVYVRTVYELLPFENQLVLVRLSGKSCQQLFELVRKANGAPVSGVTLVLGNDASKVTSISGKPFDPEADYWLLTSDYLANGGDEAEMLKQAKERIELNVKIRDVLMKAFRDAGNRNEKLSAKVEGRIRRD